jgi:hypothetical protein
MLVRHDRPSVASQLSPEVRSGSSTRRISMGVPPGVSWKSSPLSWRGFVSRVLTDDHKRASENKREITRVPGPRLPVFDE